MTRNELAKLLDVTLVKNVHTESEIQSLIDNARKYSFACVFTLARFRLYLLSTHSLKLYPRLKKVYQYHLFDSISYVRKL